MAELESVRVETHPVAADPADAHHPGGGRGGCRPHVVGSESDHGTRHLSNVPKAVMDEQPAPSSWCREPLGSDPLTWTVSPSRCWVRWPGPAQRPLVNRVRVGRQQLSAGMAGCRSQPGRRTELRGEADDRRIRFPRSATSARCDEPSGSVRAGSHRQSPWIGSPIMADTPFVSLYRRFRPGRFDEIRGQDHVVRALRSAVRDDRVSHAYLFSGPRGTGKTSSARILAKALNCEAPVDGEPCGVCTSCVEITQGSSLNVHELDAASNNGVDAMRDLVAHASLGTPGRWKVYIVDEVHMLSTAAANALLKTLEEPPSHVVFVLATTDPQKVPPTIRSRTQHLEFRLLGAETLHSLVESVNEEAALGLDADALEAAVRRGRGSARDALSALDQVAAAGSADAARPELARVLEALADGDVQPGPGRPECAGGGRLGPPAAGDRAHRRPAPGVPLGAGPRAVRRVGVVARALHRPGRGDGTAACRAQHRDPGPRAGRHARGTRRAGRARDRRRAGRAARPRLGDGGAVGAGEPAGAHAVGRRRVPASGRAGRARRRPPTAHRWAADPRHPRRAGRGGRERPRGRGQASLHRCRAAEPAGPRRSGGPPAEAAAPVPDPVPPQPDATTAAAHRGEAGCRCDGRAAPPPSTGTA